MSPKGVMVLIKSY